MLFCQTLKQVMLCYVLSDANAGHAVLCFVRCYCWSCRAVFCQMLMLVMLCYVLSDANAGHAVLCFVRCVSRSYGGKRPASLWPYRKSCSPSMPSMPTGRCCGFVILLLPLCIRGYDCNALSFQSAVGQCLRECPCLMSDQNSLSSCFVLPVSC